MNDTAPCTCRITKTLLGDMNVPDPGCPAHSELAEQPIRARLPYWIEQKVGYGGQVFLHGVFLGFTKGQWPVHTFAGDADGGCSMGARWVAEDPEERVLVGPIVIPDETPVLSVKRTPEKIDLVPR